MDYVLEEDLFEGEPEGFDPEPNPFARTLEEELADLYGSNAPLHAFDDYDMLKVESEEEPASSLVVDKIHQPPDMEIVDKEQSGNSTIERSHTIEPSGQTSNLCDRTGSEPRLKVGRIDTQTVQDTASSQVPTALADCAFSCRKGWIHHERFEELLERAITPSELELEQMDFQLQKIVAQIDSISVRQELHKIDPTLSKRKLFRIYRHAMKKLEDSDDEDAHQEEDAKRFGVFARGSDDSGGISLDCSSKDTSRYNSKESATGNLQSDSSDPSRTKTNDSSQRSSSSLLQARPHLQELSPTDVEGHFLTTTSRPLSRSKSRTSSLASETRFERGTTTAEFVSTTPPLNHKISASNDAQVYAQSGLLPAPLFHSAYSRTPISERKSLLRAPAASPSASTYAVAGSPAPNPASITHDDFSLEDLASEGDSTGDLTPYASSASQLSSTRHRPRPLSIENLKSSDPFAAGVDQISFSPSTYSPPLSPLYGLAGQIHQPKRQTRRKLDGEDMRKEKSRKSHSRAFSARSPSKAQVSARRNMISQGTKRAMTLGVQGNDAKVNKNRATRRKSSSKVKARVDEAESVPRVPSLPLDMDVDLPLPELGFSLSADETAPLEAEGGKHLNESQGSPYDRKTRETTKKNKANPTQTTAMRDTNGNGDLQERSSLLGLDTAGSSPNGATPSPSPRKPSTRGIAVRKTRASARTKTTGQDLREVEDVGAVQISSPKAKPLPVNKKQTATPVKQDQRLATPSAVETDITENVSPTTPRRGKKSKAATGTVTVANDAASDAASSPSTKRERSLRSPQILGNSTNSDTTMHSILNTPARTGEIETAGGKLDNSSKTSINDQNKLTPTSAGKAGKGRMSTPTRRSPRIARMNEAA